ncbi:GrpB family protein [Kitasatospora sp. NPDC001539]|uniref:GrpB family protein n=1 Tax=Kitasatospora sp. NPDC001539 TaxID=3154384 RepID=UPI00331B0EBB
MPAPRGPSCGGRASAARSRCPAGAFDQAHGRPGGTSTCTSACSAPNERLALLFRDWFRAHPEAVPAYPRFKSVLAGTVHDTGVYADVKDPVVDLVIPVAESWALATSWTPHTDTSPRT